jgi:hypothetical protein
MEKQAEQSVRSKAAGGWFRRPTHSSSVRWCCWTACLDMLAQIDARECGLGHLLLFFVYLFRMALPLTLHRKQRMRLVAARNKRTSLSSRV